MERTYSPIMLKPVFNFLILEGDILGQSDNMNTAARRGAITYGLANAGGYSETNVPSNFVKPQMVANLPGKIELPKPGPLETVDELPSSTTYYDGSNNLNKVTITCRVYANPTKCLHQSNCGWCGSSNGCISGTNLGPLEPCKKSSYIFSAPFPNWNPQTRVINEKVGGMSLTLVNK
jgi:hypothetical protein